MAHEVFTRTAAETRDLGRVVGGLCEAGDVVLLAGELGAGKTTFVQGLAAGLGIDEPVVSPTFVLAREYRGRLDLVHVDAYRVGSLAEFDDLGVLETTRAVVVVEWGDAVAARLPAERLEVTITRPGDPSRCDDDRIVQLAPLGAAWVRRSGALPAGSA